MSGTKKSRSVMASKTWQQTDLSTADFSAAPAEGTSISAGEIREIMRSEVEEDGQLSSYDAVQLGEELGPTGRSPKGKITADIRDGNDAQVDGRTEIRIIARPKNGDSRTPLTRWYKVSDLRESNPQNQIPLPPVTNPQGQPRIVGEGRIIAIEVRNTASSVTVSKANSTVDIPAKVGY